MLSGAKTGTKIILVYFRFLFKQTTFWSYSTLGLNPKQLLQQNLLHSRCPSFYPNNMSDP